MIPWYAAISIEQALESQDIRVLLITITEASALCGARLKKLYGVSRA